MGSIEEFDKDVKLLDPKVFVQEFYNILPNHSSQIEAYDTLEERYSRVFGHNKYSCWKSFAVTRSRILKNNNRIKKK